MSTDTPLSPNNLYAACKASAYMTLSHLFCTYGVEFAWCRLFYLFGADEDERRLIPYIRARLEGGQNVELSSGVQVRDFLDVEVAAQMIVDTVLSDRQGPVNVCSGIPVTIRQVAEKIAESYGLVHLLQFDKRPDLESDPPFIVGLPTSD